MAYELEEELGELEDELEDEGEFEDEGEDEDEAGLEGEGWLGAIGNIASSLLGESEDEGEYEDEYEVSPVRKIYPDAMMEHLGELAAEAETEDEAAEHFLPLIGMAASKLLPVVARAVAPAAKRLLPKIAKAVTRATPHLTRRIGTVAKTLHRNPQTRHLLKTVPTIARRTVGSIARQAASGGRVTPATAVKTLTRQARHVLAHPQHRRAALRHHQHLERRLHHRYGRSLARPHSTYGHYTGRTAHGIHGTAGISRGTSSARAGHVVGGRCSCGGSAAHASPAYCRCCGQVLR
jgi:hypothetical protein